METKILSGTLISKQIKDELKNKISLFTNSVPTLAVILVGQDPASKVYVKNKENACNYVGIKSISHSLDENTSEEELLSLIQTLNQDKEINGILVQLPLPKHIDENKVILAIDPKKDVDCFHPYNVGLVSLGNKNNPNIFLPCTPAGIIQLLKRYNIEIEGKNCVVVGRSNIVGKPISTLLLSENGTVTTCHSKTKNLAEICSNADILVAAIGKPKFIKNNMVKENSVIIDVGIHRQEDGTLCGDVDFDNVIDKVSYITPVPGGVGPMTIAMLLSNCVRSYENTVC